MTDLVVNFGSQLPASWTVVAIQEIVEMSPKLVLSDAREESLVHFVPMAAVAEDFGGLDASQVRPLREVRKGYTSFSEGDVLFAKITPCMENGKGAIVPKLEHRHGFGSTEFHVLRPSTAITSKWLAYYLSQPDFRHVARQNMTGTAGQLRVPSKWLGGAGMPIPPRAEQNRIVEKLEELLSDLDAGVAELKAAQRKLAQYRQSLLKAAVEGALTADWRMAHDQPQETGAELLQRILSERRARWEQKQLAKFKEQCKIPPKDWQAKYPEPVAPDFMGLPQLPDTWVWASLDMLGEIASGVAKGTKKSNGGVTREVPYLRVANVQRGYLDLTQIKTIEATGKDIADLRLEPGDVLFNEGGDLDKLGRGWVWYGEVEECIHQNHVFRMRPILSATPPEFISHHGNTFGKEWFKSAGKQTTNLASINMTMLRAFPVPVAPESESREVLARLRLMLSAIVNLEKNIEQGLAICAAQRKNVLKTAFSGQLVPQDPRDESATTLLARVRAERDARVGSTTANKRGRKARKSA